MIEFDHIHFTESTFGIATLVGSDLMVPISGVFLFGEASRTEPSQPLSGCLIFRGVQRSVRTVTEYIGDPRNPDGFKDRYPEEQEFAPASEDAQVYAFEGVQMDPAAWIDWRIWATSFEFVKYSAN